MLARLSHKKPLHYIRRRVLLSAASIALALAPWASAQASGMEDPRIWTLTAGVGNPMGWYGLQAEGYFARGRFSGFAGAGYAPVADVAFAAGLRGYTSGSTHRGFAELSVSLLYISTVGNALGEFENVEYGPGIQVGYQYVRRNGLTLAVSIGIGSSGAEGASPMMGLGIGKTWRRR